MAFFDEDPKYLPEGSQYYYDVLVIDVAVDIRNADYFFPGDIYDIWYTDYINSSRPKLYHFFVDFLFNAPWECEVQVFPHQVVEIEENNSIWFYDMNDDSD